MSLHPSDVKLLNGLYRLKPEKAADLNDFARPLVTFLTQEWDRLREGEEFPRKPPQKAGELGSEAFVAALRRLQSALICAMNDLADRAALHPDCVLELRDIQDYYAVPPILLMTYDDDESVRPGSIRRWQVRFNPTDGFLNILAEKALELCNSVGRVRRCEVCRRSYIMQKVTEKNRFCSERCGAIAHQRDLRLRQKQGRTS
jgi:hypothetical protein